MRRPSRGAPPARGFCGSRRSTRARSPRRPGAPREVEDGISDLQFTDALSRARSSSAATSAGTSRPAPSLESSDGVTVTDLDGNRFYDLTGSYGVNVFGYDFYKDVHRARRSSASRELGPVLGAYHPVVAYNVARLRAISGLDEVSFHMSGTEAVMQAVRLARYHTGRSHLVRFCGAYHGWWDDVQPGVGNPPPAREIYTLRGDGRRHAAGAAHAPRHRLRAGQSAAGAASERERAGRFDAARQRAPARASIASAYTDVAAAAARGLHRAGDPADLRRGVRRLPTRAGRRPGVLRRPRRPRHLRQDRSAAACRSASSAAAGT